MQTTGQFVTDKVKDLKTAIWSQENYPINFCKESNSNSSIADKFETFPDLLENARKELSSLADITDGWDGEKSKGPSREIIDDALLFLRNWPAQSMIPEPELMFDGSIALQFYRENGNSRGGVEFHKNHKGVYAILNENNVYETGLFKTNSITEIVVSARVVKTVLSRGIIQ